MSLLNRIKVRIKARNNFVTRFIYSMRVKQRFISLPAPGIIFKPLLFLHIVLRKVLRQAGVFFYWQPLFKQYLVSKPKNLSLTHSMPYIIGVVSIEMGEYCVIGGKIVICGRVDETITARLNIGHKVFIGFNTQFYVAEEITIGDHCLISEDCVLRSYSGHPLNPEERLARAPEKKHQMRAIVLERNVWLCQGVKINPGVHIGENSVIATGSVVTQNIPANVLAGGIPAKVIRQLS